MEHINVCKIHNLLRAKVGAERQGGTNLAHARTCGVTKACKSKCCKRCLWTMHSSQASTLLGWSVCMANAVWTQIIVFAKNATQCNHTPHHTTLPHNHTSHHTTHPAKPLHNTPKLSPEYFHACAKGMVRYWPYARHMWDHGFSQNY